MKEYIERAAVEKFIQDGLNNPDKDKAFGHDAIEILAGIHFMLAADVVPVRHGRWMDAESDDGCIVWHCSVCSYPVKTIGGYPIYHYCPSCGARMDKEDKHEVS